MKKNQQIGGVNLYTNVLEIGKRKLYKRVIALPGEHVKN